MHKHARNRRMYIPGFVRAFAALVKKKLKYKTQIRISLTISFAACRAEPSHHGRPEQLPASG